MDFNKYIELALAIHAAASIIVALTPTPHDDRILGKLYKVIETLALVVGKAKQRWSIRQCLKPNFSPWVRYCIQGAFCFYAHLKR